MRLGAAVNQSGACQALEHLAAVLVVWRSGRSQLGAQIWLSPSHVRRRNLTATYGSCSTALCDSPRWPSLWTVRIPIRFPAATRKEETVTSKRFLLAGSTALVVGLLSMARAEPAQAARNCDAWCGDYPFGCPQGTIWVQGLGLWCDFTTATCGPVGGIWCERKCYYTTNCRENL